MIYLSVMVLSLKERRNMQAWSTLLFYHIFTFRCKKKYFLPKVCLCRWYDNNMRPLSVLAISYIIVGALEVN
jgi:hypothetical protein